MDDRLAGWLKEAGYAVERDSVRIEFTGGRSHKVRIQDGDGDIDVTAIVVRASVVEALDDLPLTIWRLNRSPSVVGFRLDAKKRLIGHAWLPRQGLAKEEVLTAVQQVASESDRLEFVLTGRDTE